MGSVCIHCHFYQPPRENPWLEAVEIQESSSYPLSGWESPYPYHDWNDRITAECYAPNAFARFLGGEFLSNYEFMSFDFGPTLLLWLEKNVPEVHEKIVEADRKSRGRFSGHGSAIAHPFYHVIMPLASRRDRRTLLRWAVEDFRNRFGRSPEGIWLPEMAVDLLTLELALEFNLKFTILSPKQVKRVKGEGGWQDGSGHLETGLPYVCRLPSGREISIIFRDEEISTELAFKGLAKNGRLLAEKLLRKSSSKALVCIALDGETFGHHYLGGDAELAKCFEILERGGRLTIPAEYLEENPPSREVEILENTSWSCVHGVERWRSGCSCNTGLHPGWSQAWRGPLRMAIDRLLSAISEIYGRQASVYLLDPWAARDEYVELIWERTRERVDEFLSKHAVKEMSEEEKVKVLKLLEMEKQALEMLTSCGWFFDDISHISTVQILHRAARAMQLAFEASGVCLEKSFLNLLRLAASNIPEMGGGEKVYMLFVPSSKVDHERIAANFAILHLISGYPIHTKLYSWDIVCESGETISRGEHKLGLGRVEISNNLTLEKKVLDFASLWHGGPEAWVFEPGVYDLRHLAQIFSQEGPHAILKYFGKLRKYSMRDLLEEERRNFEEKLAEMHLIDNRGAASMPAELKKLIKNEDFKKAEETLQQMRLAGVSPSVGVISLLRGKLRKLLEEQKDMDKIEKVLSLLSSIKPGIESWRVRKALLPKISARQLPDRYLKLAEGGR